MITVEGAVEGTCIGAWISDDFGPTIPVTISPYTRGRRYASPVIPAGFILPPAGPAARWYDTSLTPYGGTLQKYDVGSIFSIDDSPSEEHPCVQSTIHATCFPCRSGAEGPHFTVQRQSPYGSSVTRYTTVGQIVSFLEGRPTNTTLKSVYNEKAVKISITPVTGNSRLWSADTALFGDVSSPDFSSSFRPRPLACHDTWLWTAPVNPAFPSPNTSQHTSWVHVSRNVWKETVTTVYHSAASYTPASPVGYDGFGLVVAQEKLVRYHTLKFIQQYPVGCFRGQFSTVCESKYSGYKYPNRISGEANGSNPSLYTATIMILEPGASESAVFDRTKADDYCRQAIGRATQLFRSNDMKIARSNAIANVKALESNWIENLLQAKDALKILSPLVYGWSAVKRRDLKSAKRALASAYLAYKYAVLPGIADAKDISKNASGILPLIGKNRFQDERRYGSYYNSTPVLDTTAELSYHCSYQLRLKDTSFAVVLNALERLGLDPSAANAWDLIPFSFVLDWFTHIGDALSHMSAYNNAFLSRDLLARVESFKAQWPISEALSSDLLGPNLIPIGEVSYSWYDRRIYSSFGSIDPFAGRSLSSPTWDQMVQGGALISAYR